jgi:tRNA nucleotidyltransferase (CCA-adding enzyme)
LYLVGGTVRDLLLERCNIDLDLVVEGDAIKLAEDVSKKCQGKITSHPRFGTAKLKWGGRSADFASTRSETYTRPGALPNVKAGTIKDDLARRDFTINAMAVELTPRHYGELIDPYGGRQDLGRNIVRVLYEKSFIDDATRIWRAVRYEQRLDFRLEPMTQMLVKRDIDRLKTISGDRLRHELELVLREELPEKTLRRAYEIGALERLQPALRYDEWLAETFATARERSPRGEPPLELYLALLCYRLNAKDLEQLVKYLRLPKASAQILRDTLAIKAKVRDLAKPGQAPSAVYEMLYGYHLIAYTANVIGIDSETAAEHIELYLNVLRHINPILSGEDLQRLGIARGPKIKEVLQRLHGARLDGKVESREEEEVMARGWRGKVV